MAAEEVQVIRCHTYDEWTVQLTKAKESNKLIVIGFTDFDSEHDQVIAPIIADMAKKFKSTAIFFELDVGDLESIAREYGVEELQTFVFIKGGEVVDKVGVGVEELDFQAILLKHTGAANP